jgi:hypothetical protein
LDDRRRVRRTYVLGGVCGALEDGEGRVDVAAPHGGLVSEVKRYE